MAEIPVFPCNLSATIVRHATMDTLADRAGNPTPAHVLSTPTLVSWFEAAVSQAMLPYLPPDLLILGARIEIYHRRPTPPGHDVRIKAVLTEQQGNKTTWQLEAHDEQEPVADGTVVSALVDSKAFNQRLYPKQKPWFSTTGQPC